MLFWPCTMWCTYYHVISAGSCSLTRDKKNKILNIFGSIFCLNIAIITWVIILKQLFASGSWILVNIPLDFVSGNIHHYNPPINFRVILLATLRHVVQIAGQLSRNNPRPIWFVVRLFPSREKHSQHKNSNFSFLLFNMEGNQTSLIESTDSDLKECCSGKYKKLSRIKYLSWQTKL